MRIAVVNQHLSDAIGGSELQCDLVARGLAARGHQVVYVAVRPGGLDTVSRDSGRDPSASYSMVPVEGTSEAIVGACRSERAEVVYWRFNRRLLRPVSAGLRREGIPLVFAVAHIDDVSPWPVRAWGGGSVRARVAELRARARERRSWSGFRDVAAVASQRRDFMGRVPVADQRYIPNLMSDEFEPYGHERPYVAWVGSLQRRKRPALLARLGPLVSAHGMDLLAIGQIRDERYRALFDGSVPGLRHLGILSPARTLGVIAGATALAVTADEEGFANVLLQAWWYGTPTVSLSHDPDGLIASRGLGASCRGDIRTMLHALEGIVTQDEVGAAELRARTQAFAREAFSSERTLEDLERLLSDVVRHPVT